jgi:hypothetical protein
MHAEVPEQQSRSSPGSRIVTDVPIVLVEPRYGFDNSWPSSLREHADRQ